MVVYRNAVATDGAALDAMARRVWLATFGYAIPPADVALYVGEAFGPRGSLVREMMDPAFDYRIALHEGQVIGYAKIGPPFFQGEVDTTDALQLRQLYVDPAHHGSGVAADLLDWAFDRARARGADQLLLTVWDRNDRAIAFYHKHGFEAVGQYAFRTGRQVDRDIIMRVRL